MCVVDLFQNISKNNQNQFSEGFPEWVRESQGKGQNWVNGQNTKSNNY